jgi:hypothetical protein
MCNLQSLGLAMPVKRDGLYLHGNVSPSFYHYQVGPLHRGVICPRSSSFGFPAQSTYTVYLAYHKCLSPRSNWDPIHSHASELCPSPGTKRERTHLLAGEKVGGPNSYDRRKSLVLCIPVVPDHRGAESYDDHKKACMTFQNSLKLSSNKYRFLLRFDDICPV